MATAIKPLTNLGTETEISVLTVPLTETDDTTLVASDSSYELPGGGGQHVSGNTNQVYEINKGYFVGRNNSRRDFGVAVSLCKKNETVESNH